jgi:hypothetical protein
MSKSIQSASEDIGSKFKEAEELGAKVTPDEDIQEGLALLVEILK